MLGDTIINDIFNPSFHTGGSLDYTDEDVNEIYANSNDAYTTGETSYYLHRNIRDSLITILERNNMLLSKDQMLFRSIIGTLVKTNLCLVKYEVDDDASDDLDKDDVLSRYGNDIDVIDEYLCILSGESKHVSSTLLDGYPRFLKYSGLMKKYPFLVHFHPTQNMRKSFRRFLRILKEQYYMTQLTSLTEVPECKIITGDKHALLHYLQETGDDIFDY